MIVNERVHTPYDIMHLMNIYAISGATFDFNAHVITTLMKEGLIEVTSHNDNGYRCTDKGCLYVESLCTAPLPVQQWVIPHLAK